MPKSALGFATSLSRSRSKFWLFEAYVRRLIAEKLNAGIRNLLCIRSTYALQQSAAFGKALKTFLSPNPAEI
jgi:hypothetical protein